MNVGMTRTESLPLQVQYPTASNALVDDKGRLDTHMNRFRRMGKRLRHQCTWIRKPFYLAWHLREMENPVPILVLTDAEGGHFFLEDDKEYEE